jgi:predicted dehydrogenase
MADQPHDVSRRDFLSAAGAATLAGSFGLKAAVSAQAELGSDRKIRIGVVGGGFGASFQWHLDPNCIVEAVSDLREDRRAHLQRVYQCDKPYESLEKLVLDPKIDAVAVFTEAPNHVRHVVEVMKHGKHCISAVPAAVSLEECQLLKETKERTGLKYMMAETSYYRAPTMLGRLLWADGKFGNFLYSEVEYYHPGIGAAGDGLSTFNGQRTWRYGYPPMLYPTHSTAFHVGVTRERLTKVSCLGWGDDDPARKDNAYGCPYANQSALFQTSGGNICRCNVFWKVWAHGERAQWLGENLSMFMDSWAGQPFVIKAPGQADITTLPDFLHLLPEPMRAATGHGNSHGFLTHEFIAALVGDREPAVDVYESLAMTAPGIVAMDSTRKGGEQLAVPSFDKA